MRFHTLLPGVRVLPAAMVCAAVFLAVSMSGCIAWAQDPIPVKELKQNFDRTYKNEEVRVHGQVSAEKRVDSQTYKGFYLKDRFGDLILVRTTAPLPEISSFVTVTGVALRDADTGDVFVSETRREGGTAPAAAAAPAPAAGGAPAPADDSARRQAEEQRMREEEERRKAEQEADDQRQMLMLGGIGLAIAVLIGIAVYLMRRKPEPELAAPMFAPSAPAQPPAEKTQPGAPPPPPIERPAPGPSAAGTTCCWRRIAGVVSRAGPFSRPRGNSTWRRSLHLAEGPAGARGRTLGCRNRVGCHDVSFRQRLCRESGYGTLRHGFRPFVRRGVRDGVRARGW